MREPSLTREAAEFCAALTFESIPGNVVHLVKRCLIDALGVELASVREPVMSVLDGYLAEFGGREQARATRAGGKLPYQHAALRNATLGHAMDWDDTQLAKAPDRIYGYLTHPSTTSLAAALALAERGGIDGRRFICAFLAGFEVQCKFAEAISPEHARRGYQSTATLGTFGAAATAAIFLGADAAEIARAFGMAGSMAAGIKANFGTMAKLVQVGRAAENGVAAALLAHRNLTASESVLEGATGYFAVAGPGGNPELVAGTFGAPFSIEDPGVSIKPYPSAVLTHQTIDAVRDLVRERGLTPADIDTIRIDVGSNISQPIGFAFANEPLEGKFCLPFLCAAMIVDGRIGAATFTEAYVARPDVVAMEKRITLVLDPEVDALGYDKIRSRLVVELARGKRIVQWADERYRGGPERPFTDAEVEEKFRVCADGVLSPQAQSAVLDALWGLERASDARRLLDLVNA